ncbi:MAG: shikimate dehydrogenase family protein [Runella sp.]
MRVFGLIGFPLKHSFSKKYFTEKFERENIKNCRYELFELPEYQAFRSLLEAQPDLVGLNVTIPHKQNVMPFLDELDAASAARIGAVNTIKILPDGRLKGYNTDYYGFKTSLENWLNSLGIEAHALRALVLGNGGAAKAVKTALEDLGIDFQTVSRQANHGVLSYADIDAIILTYYHLIINTSPVGTYPDVETAPDLPYSLLTSAHLLYDLVYNPAETAFLRKGAAQGAATHNGLAMLHLQAEKAWEIWND